MLPSIGFVAKNEAQQVYYEHLLGVFDGKMTPAAAYDSMNDKIPALVKAAGG